MSSLSHFVKRRKCIIGAALVVEIVLFSIITFVIAYVSSLNAIHHASQKLADSMVDTVSVRVVGYFESTEASVRQAALVNRYASLPADYAGPASSWSTEWLLQMRSLMMAEGYSMWIYGIQFDDASMVAVWMNNVINAVVEFTVDARDALALGYRNVTMSAWDTVTKQHRNVTAMRDLQYPGGRDRQLQLNPGYYFARSILRAAHPSCSVVPLTLNPDGLAYNTGFFCPVFNKTGDVIGALSGLRDITALTTFLQQTAATPNTEIFILDGESYLVAATTSDPTFITTLSNGSGLSRLRPGCISSKIINNNDAFADFIGCRASASTYSYAPLRSLAETSDTAHYLTSTERVSAYLSLAGSMYFIVCMPVALNHQWSPSSMFLILFLPEADVLRGVQDGLVTAVVVCVVLCVIGAMLSSFLVVTVLDVPLRRGKSSSSRRPVHDVSQSRTFAFMSDAPTIYNKTLSACRNFSRLHAAAVDMSSLHLSVFELDTSVPSDVVILVAQRASTADAEDESSSAAAASSSSAFDAHVAAHGGETVPGSRLTTVRVALWRCGDDAELRAILCGLTLLRSDFASRCAVTRGCICRRTADIGAALRDALTLLVSAAEKCVRVSQGLLDGTSSYVFIHEEDSDDQGSISVTGVAPDAWDHVPRRVRFAVNSSLSIQVLLQRATHGI